MHAEGILPVRGLWKEGKGRIWRRETRQQCIPPQDQLRGSVSNTASLAHGWREVCGV